MEERHFDALLLGGGVAAARCARTLRRAGFDGSIGLVGDEATLPYNRPPLSKELLRAEAEAELILAEPASWYERRNVELLLGTPAVSVDPAAHRVELADGRQLHYGRLLLATGAEARRPPIRGAERALELRTVADALAIRQRADPAARAVVIGGGFIGVEVAASLAGRGCAVTVLEQGAALWGGQLGTAVSDWALERLHRSGVRVRFDAAASAIGPTGVHLGAELLPADLVVAGVGVSPRDALAVDAGLEVDDGVLVDEEQRTSDPTIVAAGDVARPRGGLRVEHWHAAREGGERAAIAMLDGSPPPRRAAWIFSEFADATLDVVGSAPRVDEVVVDDGVVRYLVRGRVAQVAILDSAIDVGGARELLERRPLPTAAGWDRASAELRRAGGSVIR
jgi:NADPH-dependent 2,4-dienoyl-CoA reductase/sulfur reductase-like enzyme